MRWIKAYSECIFVGIVIIEVYADVTQLARVTAFQAVGCAFESRRPLHLQQTIP